jgi:hypothetical protein
MLALSPALDIDFSDTSTITITGSGISSVTDKSGNGHTYTQGTDSMRPPRIANVQNGLHVARFDGTNDRLSNAARTIVANTTACTMFVVRKWAASPTAARTSWCCSTNNGTASRAQVYGGNASGLQGAGGRIGLNASTFAGLNGATVSSSVFEIDTAILDAGANAITIWLNSTQAATGAFLSGSFPNNSSQSSAIGMLTSATQFFNGDIGRIVVFNYGLSEAQRNYVWGILRAQWAIFAP